jgi:hypothetical protein
VTVRRLKVLGLAGLLCAGVASSSLAQSPTSPSFSRHWQGTTIAPARVSCATTSTTLVSTSNALSVTMRNEGATTVYICDVTPCTSSAALGFLNNGDALTIDRAARDLALYCIANSAASVVYAFVEKP